MMTTSIGGYQGRMFTHQSRELHENFLFWGPSPADTLYRQLLPVGAEMVEVYVTADEWDFLSTERQSSNIEDAMRSLRDPEVLHVRAELFEQQECDRVSLESTSSDSDSRAAGGESDCSLPRYVVVGRAAVTEVAAPFGAELDVPALPISATRPPCRSSQEGAPKAPPSGSLRQRLKDRVLATVSNLRHQLERFVRGLITLMFAA